MKTKPATLFRDTTPDVCLQKEPFISNNGKLNNQRFEKLFAAVFDSMKMQDMVGNTALSDMLNTIANISNHHGR